MIALVVTGVESEIVRSARVAREHFELGRVTGVELAVYTTDAFLLDLGDAPDYDSASDADWEYYLHNA